MSDEIIKSRFKEGFSGIVRNSGGYKELFYTQFNLYTVLISIFIISLYFCNIKTAKESLLILDKLNTSVISLLGGIVGLSLAGLTMIITFSNPEIIERSSKKQFEEFLKNDSFNISYFQKAIAKFSFIVFFQIVTLIFLFISATVKDFDIKVPNQLAYWFNSIIFCISIYMIVFSLILVIASILNLFTFSQTSNFFNFVKQFPEPPNKNDEQNPK